MTTRRISFIRYAASLLFALLAYEPLTLLSLKLSHILRYSAEPPIGFEKTDGITAVSLVAKILRPQP